MDASVTNSSPISGLLALVQEKIQSATDSELTALAKSFFSHSATEPDNSASEECEGVDVEDVTFSWASDETRSDAGVSSSLFQTLQKCQSLSDICLAVTNASETEQDQFLEESGLDRKGFSNVREYLHSELFKERALRIEQQTATFLPILELQVLSEALTKNSASEISSPEIEDFIGSAEEPGIVIRRLDSLSSSDKISVEQKTQISKIKNCFLQNIKLTLFPDNASERRSTYQHFASRLMQVFETLDEGSLLSAFVLGEGSLCELAEVCRTGWRDRIEAKLTPRINKSNMSSFVLSSITPLRRQVVKVDLARAMTDRLFGDQAPQFYGDGHTTTLIEKYMNGLLSLGYSGQELETNETLDFVTLFENSFNPNEMKALFTEKCTPQRLQEQLKIDLEKLTTSTQEELVEQLSQLYEKSCKTDSSLFIDPLDALREIYRQVEDVNPIANSPGRTTALKKMQTLVQNQYGFTPFSMLPKQLSALQNKLREGFCRAMQGFIVAPTTQNVAELKSRLVERDEWNILETEDKEVLDNLADEDQFLDAQRSGIAHDLTRLDTKVIEMNGSLFKKLITVRNPETGSFLGISDFGIRASLASAGVIIPKGEGQFSSKEGAKLFTALARTATEIVYDTSEKSGDAEQILALLPEKLDILLLADEKLLQDKDFILAAVKINLRAIQYSKLTTKEFITEILEQLPAEKIPEFFSALPDIHKATHVVKKAFDKCYDSAVFGFYASLPEDLKKNPEIVEKALDKGEALSIPRFYASLPEDLKKNPEIVEKALDKCSAREVFGFYESLPEELKKKPEIVEKAFNKCGDLEVPKLYGFLPEELKKKPEIVEKAFDKCRDSSIARLYKGLPEDLQKNPEILEKTFNKCHKTTISYFYAVLPEGIKQNPEIVDKAFDKCDKNFIDQLYAVLPEDLKKKPEIIEKVFDKCDENIIDELYAVLPEGIKEKPEILEKVFDKCGSEKLLELYRALPKNIKLQPKTFEKALNKCFTNMWPPVHVVFLASIKQHPEHIHKYINKYRETCSTKALPALYDLLPRELQFDADVAIKILAQCNSADVQPLFDKFPKEIKDDPVIVEFMMNFNLLKIVFYIPNLIRGLLNSD